MLDDLVEKVARAIDEETVRLQGMGRYLVTGYNDSQSFARAALRVMIPAIIDDMADRCTARANRYLRLRESLDPHAPDCLNRWEARGDEAMAVMYDASAIRERGHRMMLEIGDA